MRCKKCRETITEDEKDEGYHECDGSLIRIDSSFLSSMIIGAVTGSAILGGLLGGDLLGGILGDSFDSDLMD